MATGRILVVAPELDLRRSLEFVLEAEGFEVLSRPRIDFGNPLANGRFDCTVLDHRALAGPPERAIRFCTMANPVVLLSSKTIPWLSAWVACVVEKPLLGDSLSRAVRQATGLEGVRSH